MNERAETLLPRRREYVRLPRHEYRAVWPWPLVEARRLVSAGAYLALAWARGGPGIAMRRRIADLAVRLLVRRTAPARTAWEMLVAPMDSFRYFEFEFAWRAAWEADPVRYLDVSSPRLFPITLTLARPRINADLINPDERDLATTRDLVQASGIASRCSLHLATVEAAPMAPGRYDLVTALSVLEHIPEPADSAAVERLWCAVRPGGKMIVTLPCARMSFDEYLDLDEYGLQQRPADGFFFGQRFYDEELLAERFFRVCGRPHRIEVLGERFPGTFNADRALKVAGRSHLERDPYMIATEYRRFVSPRELPGVGVVALEFVKPDASASTAPVSGTSTGQAS